MSKNQSSNSKIEQLFTNPEPWEPWESKLVIWSIAIAIIASIILAVIINWLIL